MLVPYPPQEPTSLDEPVDWMAWSHADLYRMVHSGANTAQTERTADLWADVARELHDIVDRLGKAVGASEAGWQGEAAMKAREGMRTVLAWAAETVVRAERVRHAIHAEADHLEWAKAAMPEPVPAWHGGGCGVVPEFQLRSALVVVPPRQQADAAHREAAEVMARFQHGSSKVDETIPAFAAPTSPVITDGEPETTTPSRGGDGGGHRQAAAPVSGGGPRPPVRADAPVGGQESTRTVPAEQPARTPPQQQQTTSGRSGGMGGMGAGGGVQREEDHEHRTPAYLQEDSDVFGSNTPVAPPVLGA